MGIGAGISSSLLLHMPRHFSKKKRKRKRKRKEKRREERYLGGDFLLGDIGIGAGISSSPPLRFLSLLFLL